MRAMMLEFPGDAACAYLDRQYMLGPDMLVAPVFNAEGAVSYFLPEGRWTRLLPIATAAEAVNGGRWLREQHGFASLPLLARPEFSHPLRLGRQHSRLRLRRRRLFSNLRARRGRPRLRDIDRPDGGRPQLPLALLRGARLVVKLEGRKGRYRVRVRASRAALREELARGYELEAGGNRSSSIGVSVQKPLCGLS